MSEKELALKEKQPTESTDELIELIKKKLDDVPDDHSIWKVLDDML